MKRDREARERERAECCHPGGPQPAPVAPPALPPVQMVATSSSTAGGWTGGEGLPPGRPRWRGTPAAAAAAAAVLLVFIALAPAASCSHISGRERAQKRKTPLSSEVLRSKRPGAGRQTRSGGRERGRQHEGVGEGVVVCRLRACERERETPNCSVNNTLAKVFTKRVGVGYTAAACLAGVGRGRGGFRVATDGTLRPICNTKIRVNVPSGQA